MRKGLTLIEVLTVAMILLILAAVLFPVLEGSRFRARQEACGSNLRQIAVGINLYLEANDGGWPEAWFSDPTTLLAITGKEVWKSPTDPYPRSANPQATRNAKTWVSYYLPLTNSLPFMKDLLALDPNPGVVAALHYGRRRSATLTDPYDDFLYGQTYLARLDGSVRLRTPRIRCFEDASLVPGRTWWDVFTDVEEPSPATQREVTAGFLFVSCSP